MPGFDLLRYDVPARDREWFAASRVQQFAKYPWVRADALRGVVALWLLQASAALIIAAGAILAVLWLLAVMLRISLQKDTASASHQLTQIRAMLLIRSIGYSAVICLMVISAPAGFVGPIMLFVGASLLFDLLCTLALPLIGVVSGALFVLSLLAALIVRPGVDALGLMVLAALAIGSLYYTLFQLHYMFATRTLRTRLLDTANDTIQSLLSQYDEHGTDWLIEADNKGRLLKPSARLCAALGRSGEELEGLPVPSLFEPGDERNAMLAAARRGQRFRNQMVPLRTGEERRWWSISGCAMLDQEGQRAGFRFFAQDVTAKRAAEDRVHLMATRDNLTGLVNRAVFAAQLEVVLPHCSSKAECAILFMDLDSFKLVNDTYGHSAGDAVLVEAARRIEALLGEEMLAARPGGDEFAVLAWNIIDHAEIERLGSELVSALSQPIEYDGSVLPSGASVGVALAPEHGSTGEALLRAADIALYEAKGRGRGNSVIFHSDLLNELQERRKLEMDLRCALERGEFEIHYQPLVDVASRRTLGYEALLRWNHPTRGSVPPSLFIPLAEETDLIGTIGEWVLREALNQASTWREDLSVAVNVSPAQMRGDALVPQVVSALAASGVAPKRLELEITENLLMRDGDVHLRQLHQLRSLGVRVALDDFGTGYSSLNYLRRFPLDKLKIDRSFISDIVHEPVSRAIVESVLTLAREFRMETIAEGIECEAQLTKLAEMGCECAQGFLFDRPIPAWEIPDTDRMPQALQPELTIGRPGTALLTDAGN
ncbi:putative bifunctional diguanylate cyclase/phosphodiesterase [Novosphingobium sp. M1R2S20]|uniref:Bifunctional diguanylate cyclase/phosphodiesterase n=1 Tax=Novosphingobium rhizovicinum TaxID=3228928 RepID=A0ABV3RGQ9_9SPHN